SVGPVRPIPCSTPKPGADSSARWSAGLALFGAAWLLAVQPAWSQAPVRLGAPIPGVEAARVEAVAPWPSLLPGGSPSWQPLLVQTEGAGEDGGGDDLLDEFSDGGGDDLLDEFGDGGGDDLLDEFGGEGPGAARSPGNGEPFWPAWFDLGGSIALGGAYNYQQEAPTPQRGLSRLRTTLRLELELDFPASWEAQASGIAFYDAAYELKGRSEFTPEVLDRYEDEVEFRELFVRGSPLSFLDVKVGRQVVVWGFADFIRVVDILNPLENREPGLADIEDLRLPIAMTRIDFFLGPLSLMGVAVHEIEFNKDPVVGSDFFPFDGPPPPERIPSDTGANTETGFELKGIFSGWDLAFYYAEFFDDSAHTELVVRDGVPQPRLRHSRLTMRGAAVNVALGTWLLKSEAALFDGLEFFSAQGEPFKPKERWDAMVGLDYNGINDTTITVEAVNRRIHDFEPNLDETGEELKQYALSYRGDFLNQTLTLNGILLLFGNAADEGGVQRYSVEYDVFDAFSVTGGVLIFQSAGDGNPLFQRVRLNDRVFFDIKYSF
ncbi:MAG: hypothetical protein O7A67_09920, partial [SAR324 cluster bacterium]|nr:hypothetical protein [SAR324 cluster bacterium]